MTKIAEHVFTRLKISIYSIIVGVLIGVYNSINPPIDFSLNLSFLGWAFAAVLCVIILHEGLHAATALLFGYKPRFGLKPPLVYVTFTEKIPREQFAAIALAPFIVLDAVFVALLGMGILKVFSYFCLITNTLGSVGDLWIAYKLIGHKPGSWVQDTKTGIEIWEP
jgi:hypothetical protein